MRVNSTLRIYTEAIIAPFVQAIRTALGTINNTIDSFKTYVVNGKPFVDVVVAGTTLTPSLANGSVQEVMCGSSTLVISPPTFPASMGGTGVITLLVKSTVGGTTISFAGGIVSSPSGVTPLVMSGSNLVEIQLISTRNTGVIGRITILK